jgi:uncharacterized delta-60 repeat protein
MNLPGRFIRAARLCAAMLALVVVAPTAPAQSIFDGFVPNFDTGLGAYNAGVHAMAVQPDGKLLLGGDITATPKCSRVCRLAADGTVDTTFNTGTSPPNDLVTSLVALPDGKVLIGGKFTAIGDQTRSRVARLNADGSLDPSFYDPGVSGGYDATVAAMALLPDGKILIGGSFTTIIGQPHYYVARLNANGTLDASFADPGVSATVTTLAVQPDGKILIGGDFAAAGGQTRYGVARLNTDGTLDTSFADTGANSTVTALALLPDGKVLVGGAFNSIGGLGRSSVARLNADGSLDADFTFPATLSHAVLTLVVMPDGKILIGGGFDEIDGQAHSPLTRLNSDGSLDASFSDQGKFLDATHGTGYVFAFVVQLDGKAVVAGDFVAIDSKPQLFAARLNPDGSLDKGMTNLLGPDGAVYALAEQPDGKMLVGGYFTQTEGQPRHGVARVNANGNIDASFTDPGLDNTVTALAVQTDGKVLAGGAFTQVGASLRNHLARLNADGDFDNAFVDAGVNDEVFALAVQADDRILIGGDFSQIGASARNHVARLNADGSLDGSFGDVGANGRVFALAIQADGKVLVGGVFTTIGGQPRNYFARLNADGSLDNDFVDAEVDGGVLALAVQADGKILIGGGFTHVAGVSRHYIARLNTDGSLDETFADANADFWVLTLAAQADGRIQVGGGFSQIGGQTRAGLARLNADGSLDEDFADVAVTGGAVYALAVQSDGREMIGGNFSTVQGQPRKALVRLSLPDAALQSLDLQDTTVIWNRSGTGPELASPPILFAAADCANYTVIGAMTRVAGGWQRGGVSTPYGWSCLRVQGRTSSGQSNGSQGLVESVRRVWRDDRLFANGFE